MTRIYLRPAEGNIASEKASGLVERKRPESQRHARSRRDGVPLLHREAV